MAIYHMSIKTVARSKGKSATAAAAYRSGEKIKDERTGEIFDYSRKQGVISSELIMPPDCSMSRSELWNMAETAENRKNSTVAREYELALPAELNAGERRQLVKDFAAYLVDRYGVAADVAIHEPNRKGDERNHHAHILTTTRRLTAADGLTEKTRELDNKRSGEVEIIREKWEQLCNRELSQKLTPEISRHTLEAQGVDRPPQIHVGAAAMSIVRKGKNSDRYRHNQEIKELPKLKAELNALTSASDLGRTPAKIDEKPPSLNNTREISPEQAQGLLRASAAEIAEKPLAELDKKATAEYKTLKKKEYDYFCAFVNERDRPTPKKGLFEFESTYRQKLQAQQELKLELSKAHSEAQRKREQHEVQTQAEQAEILINSRAAAEKKHPGAAAIVEQDKQRQKQEQERKAAERKLQREAQKLRRGGRGVER